MDNSVWQLCPKCGGDKITWNGILQQNTECGVCNGCGVLSTLTGLPPNKNTKNQYGQTTEITITPPKSED